MAGRWHATKKQKHHCAAKLANQTALRAQRTNDANKTRHALKNYDGGWLTVFENDTHQYLFKTWSLSNTHRTITIWHTFFDNEKFFVWENIMYMDCSTWTEILGDNTPYARMTSIDLGSMKLIWDQYEWFETLSCDIDLGLIKLTSGQ